MMKYIGWLILLLPIMMSSVFAEEASIAAIVGDDVISELDVRRRAEVLKITMPPQQTLSDEQLQRQALQILIDEKLYRQQAEKLRLSVSKEEKAKAIASIEAQNNQPAGSFAKFVEAKGLSKEEVEAQIEAQLLWNKIVTRKIRPKIIVSEQEVQEVLEHKNAGETEVTMKQIFIPVKREDVAQVAEKVKMLEAETEQVKDCDSFSQVAKTVGSAVPADTLTIPVRNLHPTMQKLVLGLEVGKPSRVIETGEAVQMVMVCSKNQAPLPQEEKAKITEMIFQKKLAIQAGYYLRALRRNGYIDIRS